MDFTEKLAISYYKTIATINEPHKVYLVQHHENHKFYVKKILDVYNLSIYRYLQENHIVGTPQIFELYEEDNQLIIIEEYISGNSLQEKIQNADFNIGDMMHYMMDLCNILEQLHSINPAVVHRDIKPSNVIITNYNRVVLLDFNAAKFYSPSSTEDTVLLGTQGYAAPEQYGFGSSTPQTDIYSLGVMLKEMLAAIHVSSKPLSDIADQCTQINPAERFADIKALRNALQYTINPNHEDKSPRGISKLIPPGFRSRKIWKMLIATLAYLFIFWAGLDLEVKNTFGIALWIERICLTFMMLFVVFGSCNYMNIQRAMPLCRSRYWIIRFIGVILLDVIGAAFIMIVLLTIEGIFFPIK